MRARRLLILFARTWNWKAAMFSSGSRAFIFFLANLSAGLAAATMAARTEFLYRAVASGFYGALTEAFARRSDTRRATWLALIVLPGVAHTVEFAVHRAAGTPRLGASIALSVLFSVIATRVNLAAMRRGLLLGDLSGRSLVSDVRGLWSLARAAVLSSRNSAAQWRASVSE